MHSFDSINGGYLTKIDKVLLCSIIKSTSQPATLRKNSISSQGHTVLTKLLCDFYFCLESYVMLKWEG